MDFFSRSLIIFQSLKFILPLPDFLKPSNAHIGFNSLQYRAKRCNSIKSPTNTWNTKISPFLQRLHMYRDTGGNPGKLWEWKASISLGWNYVYWKLECKSESNLKVRSVSSWQRRGQRNGILTHMPGTREALNTANTKVFITLHLLLFIQNSLKKTPQYQQEPDQSVSRIRKHTFKENEMPSLIGHSTLVPPAQSSDRYLGDKQQSTTDIGDK